MDILGGRCSRKFKLVGLVLRLSPGLDASSSGRRSIESPTRTIEYAAKSNHFKICCTLRKAPRYLECINSCLF